MVLQQVRIKPRGLPCAAVDITKPDHRRGRARRAEEKQRELVDEIACGEYRFQVTRSDGKRVEHKTALGLVKNIGSNEKDALLEVDRQRLRENANQHQPFRGKPKTYGQLCQHYMENELQQDQSNATIEKAYTTAETYKRILNKRVIPRFGRKSPLAIEPLEVEK